MANRITSAFNNALGSNITHISNAYSKADYVWVLFSYSELSVEAISVSVQLLKKLIPGASVDLKTKEVKEAVRVPFRDIHKKRRDTNVEYVTVLAKERNGNVSTLCENLKVLANRSFIVTDKGAVQEQKYGGDLWVDWKDKNHKPR